MDKQQRRLLYNQCRPGDTLAPDNPHYIDLDALGVRGIDWVARLAKRIELSDQPVCQLFTGLPGSGKSTELMRLGQRLESSEGEGANLLAVVVSADVSDVLLTILYAADRRLLQAEGKDLDQPRVGAGPQEATSSIRPTMLALSYNVNRLRAAEEHRR